jgi:hypothetical protein
MLTHLVMVSLSMKLIDTILWVWPLSSEVSCIMSVSGIDPSGFGTDWQGSWLIFVAIFLDLEGA